MKSLVINYDERDPWERLEREPPSAFDAFRTYRDMGPTRSIRKAWIKHTGQPEDTTRRMGGRWCEWAVKYTWTERVRLWDDHLDTVMRKAIEEEIKSTAKVHAKQCRNFAVLLNRVEQTFMDRIKNPKDLAALRTKDLLDAVLRGAALLPRLQEAEMIALGKNPNSNVTISGDPDRPLTIRHMPPAIIDDSPSEAENEEGASEEPTRGV